MAFRGITFDKQTCKSDDDALIFDTFLNSQNGRIKGCEITAGVTTDSDNNKMLYVSIAPGYFIVQGRLIEITQEHTITYDINTERTLDFQMLVFTIDLSLENTADEFNQGYFEIVDSNYYGTISSAVKDNFSKATVTLTQDDLFDGGTKYQMPICVTDYLLNVNGVACEFWIDVDVDTIWAELREKATDLQEDFYEYLEAQKTEIEQALEDVQSQSFVSNTDYNDLSSFVGNEESDIYGVEVDFKNQTVTRLARAENDAYTAGTSFDSVKPWGGRKRCIVADDGTVTAYYGDTDYDETAGNGQVMVEQPIFYIKIVPIAGEEAESGSGAQYTKVRYYISPYPKTGFKAMDGFVDKYGTIHDKIYLASYEGYYDSTNDTLQSLPNVSPTVSVTRDEFRTYAENHGDGWQISNIFSLSISQLLFLVEYASFDVQTEIGTSSSGSIKTGYTSGLGNSSGKKTSVSYRGEENLWCGCRTMIDGINIFSSSDGSALYVKPTQPYEDGTADGYTRIDYSAPYTADDNSTVFAFGIDSTYPELFLPAAAKSETDDETSMVPSEFINTVYSSTHWYALTHGGSNSTNKIGLYTLNADINSTGSNSYTSARLLYIPQSETPDDETENVVTKTITAYVNGTITSSRTAMYMLIPINSNKVKEIKSFTVTNLVVRQQGTYVLGSSGIDLPTDGYTQSWDIHALGLGLAIKSSSTISAATNNAAIACRINCTIEYIPNED